MSLENQINSLFKIKENKKLIFLQNIKELISKMDNNTDIIALKISLFGSFFDSKIYKLLNNKQKKEEILKKMLNNYNLKKEEYKKEAIFKIELTMGTPNFINFDMKKLIIWIDNVKINENELKQKNKKYFNLIKLYQKEKDVLIKQELLKKILKQIVAYIKHKNFVNKE